MINKRFKDPDSAVSDIPALKDGATLLCGGFGGAGVPHALIAAVLDLKLRNLTLVSNNAGSTEIDIALLLKHGCVGKVICSFPRASSSTVFENLYAEGKVELEVVPQGTLAERIRAGGAGIPGFYTATAFGTPLAEGKEVREFNGRSYILEEAIRGDVALIHAREGDRWGNLTYPMTSRNFGPVMATAATHTIAEVREFVDGINPENIVTPGIFVQRVVEVGQ